MGLTPWGLVFLQQLARPVRARASRPSNRARPLLDQRRLHSHDRRRPLIVPKRIDERVGERIAPTLEIGFQLVSGREGSHRAARVHLIGGGLSSTAPISATRSPFKGSSPVVSVSIAISRMVATLPSKCYNCLGTSPSTPPVPGGEVLKGRVRANALQISRAPTDHSPIARDMVMMRSRHDNAFLQP